MTWNSCQNSDILERNEGQNDKVLFFVTGDFFFWYVLIRALIYIDLLIHYWSY